MATTTKSYYDILGVPKTADDKQIKAAFRKLARANHPDANRDDSSAEERFKQVNEANEVLSDPTSRKLYDRFGDDWRGYRDAGFTGDEPQSAYRAGSNGQTRTTSYRTGSDTFTTFDADDMGGLFGNLFGRRGDRTADFSQPRPRKGQDLEAAVEVSLQEAFTGTTRRFDVDAPETCSTCSGTGFARGAPCPTCDATGVRPRRKTLEVSIPAGVASGHRIRVAGQGGEGRNGGPRGDVFLVVTVRPDPRFERDGDLLRTTIDVDVYDAVLGGEVIVPTMSGKLALTIPPGTQGGRQFRLRNQGMPKLKHPGQRGDLMVRVNITVPTDLTDDERDAFEQLRALRSRRA